MVTLNQSVSACTKGFLNLGRCNLSDDYLCFSNDQFILIKYYTFMDEAKNK